CAAVNNAGRRSAAAGACADATPRPPVKTATQTTERATLRMSVTAWDYTDMPRALIIASAVAVLSGAVLGQELVVLHIKVTLTDAAHQSVPVPRAALLVSDNPATITPRR